MPVITLITDWNAYDYYVGAMKGKLISQLPSASIIDISHQVRMYDISQAAFILRNSFRHYPEGSIHLIGVNSSNNKKYSFLIVKADGHYFISRDNGIFGLMFFKNVETIIRLTDDNSGSFEELEVFPKFTAQLGKKADLFSLGEEINTFEEMPAFRATIENYGIDGQVIYVDSYSNAITNISKELFERIGKGRKYVIYVQSYHHKINKISTQYNECRDGDLLALFNSVGLLEIAMNHGPVSQLLNINPGATIRIKFEDKIQAKPQNTLF